MHLIEYLCLIVKYSQELKGIVLPDHKLGCHPNLKGETIDPDLEKKDSMHAGQILIEIWSGVMKGDHPV